MALQEPIPVALRRKIIKIFRRFATFPVLFLCHSLRTAHRIQKTCVLFFAVLPLLLFRVRIHSLPEDISNSLRRALADATPSFPALHLYFRIASASSIIAALSLSFTAPLMVTTGSTTVISFMVSRIPFMVRAAVGPQEPFSIRPMVLF